MPLVDIFAAVRWWVVLLVLGLVGFPLTYRLLKSLPDRGYSFTKMVGLLILSYVFWLSNSIGFLRNSLGGILLALVALLLLSLWSLKSKSTAFANSEDQETLVSWFRSNWRYVLLVEALFIVAFGIWVWARAQNPAIAATEKPMEFAFLNSASRSPTYPPLDPWLSGFGISYYYFGYIMTSLLARLAAVPEQVGFNLAIAWLAAGTAIGAFGVVYNLISADKDGFRKRAMLFGLVAALAISVAGNMEILLETLRANDIGSDGLWSWIDVRDLDQPPEEESAARYETTRWWWWRSSRVIHEYHLSGRPEEGLEPIAEFPSFSFILGDMHPHVLALPFAFLAIGLSQAWWREKNRPMFDIKLWFHRQGLKSQLAEISGNNLWLLIFTAIVLGALSFLNTWDVLIYLFLIVGAFILSLWKSNEKWQMAYLRYALTLGAILAISAIILYLPFYLGFRSQAGPPFLLPMAMQPTRLLHFLVIFLLPLAALFILLVTLLSQAIRAHDSSAKKKQWLSAAGVVTSLVLGLFILMLFLGWVISSTPEGASRVHSLASELGLSIEAAPAAGALGPRLLWATSAIVQLVPEFLVARISSPALILLLVFILFVVILLFHWLFGPLSVDNGEIKNRANSTSLPFALLLVGTAALLILGPEFVYLRDNFGQRINTIFKFYYQAWILFGVAAVYSLDYLLRRYRISGVLASSIYVLCLAIALLFPFYAIQSRSIEYRGPVDSSERQQATLDGLAYLQQQNSSEYDALIWLRENVEGTPVILEAVGGQYSGFGRVASVTGLPTLLGWAGHEYQWRGNTPEPAIREPAVASVYSDQPWNETADLLNQFSVSYIYYGRLEKATYGAAASDNFEQYLDIAYQNNDVTIYRWISPEIE